MEKVEGVVSEMENVHEISSDKDKEEEVKSEQEKLKVTSSEKEEYEIEEPFSDHPQDESSEEDNDSDSEEDEEFFAPSFMTHYSSKDAVYDDYNTPEYQDFARVVHESRGFDVPPRPSNLRVNVAIVPTGDTKTLNRLASIAIEKYNKRHGTEYKFDRVIKGNKQVFRGLLYYITFAVVEEGSDAQRKWFEAKVVFSFKAISVIECHPRSTPSYAADDPHVLCSGYDVPPYPSNLKVNVATVPTRDMKTMNSLARSAIVKYNKRHGRTEYVFDRVNKRGISKLLEL